jgi:hypothetical protein
MRALEQLRARVVFSPPQRAADSLATGISPWAENRKSDLEPPQGAPH